MTGVQLIGKEAVLTRFESFNTEPWALYQGRQFVVGGLGSDSLDGWLSDFKAAGSTATYTLRVYDSSELPTSATGSADYIAAVNFKLIDLYDGQGIGGHTTKLMERIGALEKELKDRDNDDSDDNDLNSIIMGWLNDPVKLGHVASAFRQLTGATQPAGISATPVQTIAGMGNVQDADTRVTRVAAALDVLEKKDDRLIEHLEKLAALSQSDYLLFKAIISKLDAL
jgi:hypothetical protein